jgi:adenine phosphoribosyltransferase
MDLKEKFRHVMDFPKKGIDFIDITTVLQDSETYKYAIDSMVDKVKDLDFDIVIAAESRGFLFGAPIAYAMGKGLAIVRKKGKLPYKTIKEEYQLEYGTDILEMHIDSINPGQKVLLVDDLLATGGTMESIAKMVEKLEGKVAGMLFLIELEFLNGREQFSNFRIDSIIKI